MNGGTNVIDAALRFARSNPELVDCAREGARYGDRSVDELLMDAVARLRNAAEQRELVDVRPYEKRRRSVRVAK